VLHLDDHAHGTQVKLDEVVQRVRAEGLAARAHRGGLRQVPGAHLDLLLGQVREERHRLPRHLDDEARLPGKLAAQHLAVVAHAEVLHHLRRLQLNRLGELLVVGLAGERPIRVHLEHRAREVLEVAGHHPHRVARHKV